MKRITYKSLTVFSLLLTSLLANARAPAQEAPCQLKAFNTGMDENFKTPEPDLIRKTYIFDPADLSENSAYMGILLAKNDFKNAPSEELRVQIQLIKQVAAKKLSILSTQLHKVEEWSENKDYFLVNDFNPTDVLKATDSKRPTKIVLTIFVGKKEECQQSIKVLDGDSI